MSWQRATDYTYLLLRVVAGLMFFQSGALKTFGWYGGVPPDGGTVDLWSQVGIGGVMEVVGGALIILGLLTRPVAFILAGEMAVAYWQFHFKSELFWPVENGGVPAVLYCFIFLFMFGYGGGAWSVDAWWRKRRAAGRPHPPGPPLPN